MRLLTVECRIDVRVAAWKQNAIEGLDGRVDVICVRDQLQVDRECPRGFDGFAIVAAEIKPARLDLEAHSYAYAWPCFHKIKCSAIAAKYVNLSI